MKKLLFILILVYSVLNGSSQGLNAELGFNDDYSQDAVDVVAVDEFSYMVKFQNSSGSFFSYNSLLKIDTLGNIIWDAPISPQFSETVIVEEIIASENNGVYLMGFGLPTCDMLIGCFWFIQEYDSTGNVVWTKNWTDSNCWSHSLSGLSTDESNNIYVNYLDSLGSKIITLDTAGNFTDTLTVPHSDLEGIDFITNYDKIAFMQDSIFGYDANGNVLSSIGFTSLIQNMKVHDDTLFVLTADSVFTYDNLLQKIDGSSINGYSDYSNLKVNNSSVRFLSSDASNQHVITLNHQLQMVDLLSIPVTVPNGTPKDFSDSHFSCGIDHNLTYFYSIRYLDYSLNSSQDIFVNTTDIGVIDIQPTQVSAIFYTNPNVYNFKIYADVMIKNYGNNTLNDCRLNNKIEQAICNYYVYTEHFSNLNLAPGDSMWISAGLVHSQINYFSNDTLSYNLCIYTSHPDFKTDLNVPNDKYCENVIVGYVGIDELAANETLIFPNPAEDFITIQTDISKNQDYVIYSILGEKIRSGKLGLNEIDISFLSSGMYVLQILSADEIGGQNHYFMKN